VWVKGRAVKNAQKVQLGTVGRGKDFVKEVRGSGLQGTHFGKERRVGQKGEKKKDLGQSPTESECV